MELRPQFRQTEAGPVPDNWCIKSLEECVLPDAPICYGILMPGRHCHGGVPVIKVRDVVAGQIDESNLLLTHPSIDAAYKRSRLAENDVLITIRGTTGRVALVPPSLSGANITQDTARLRVRPSVSHEFLYQALQTSGAQRQVALHTIGQAVRGINIRDVRRVGVPLPKSLSEQRAVATALSDVDALLGGLDRLIAKKRDIRHGALQLLLTGRTRLPGFHEDWDHVRLGRLFSFKNGLNKAKRFFGHGTPVVNYMDVFRSSSMYSTDLDGRVSLTQAELKNFDVQKGDVFFTRTSETPDEVGIASVILDDATDVVYSGFVLRARPRDCSLIDKYKAYCFGSAFVREQIVSRASYTTRALTNGRILSDVVLPLPSRPEQVAIAAVLCDMDAELEALEARRDKTGDIRRAMMQELLTGKTRLVPAGGAHA